MTRTKSTFLALLAVLLSPMAANAVPITISGFGAADGVWDVSVEFIVPDDSVALLQSQIWWGNATLAEEFAGLVGVDLGLPVNAGTLGPLFAYEFVSSFNRAKTWRPSSSSVVTGSTSNAGRSYYATATRVPEPGTLALLGIGLLGMGAARRKKA